MTSHSPEDIQWVDTSLRPYIQSKTIIADTLRMLKYQMPCGPDLRMRLQGSELIDLTFSPQEGYASYTGVSLKTPDREHPDHQYKTTFWLHPSAPDHTSSIRIIRQQETHPPAGEDSPLQQCDVSLYFSALPDAICGMTKRTTRLIPDPMSADRHVIIHTHAGYDITGRLTQKSPSNDVVMATYISFRQTLPQQPNIAEETHLHFHLTPYHPDAWLPHAVYRQFFENNGRGELPFRTEKRFFTGEMYEEYLHRGIILPTQIAFTPDPGVFTIPMVFDSTPETFHVYEAAIPTTADFASVAKDIRANVLQPHTRVL